MGKKLEENPSLILEAGGVGTLRYVSSWGCERRCGDRWKANEMDSYEHHSIEEPAILLGGAFVVDVVEKEEEKDRK